MATNTLKADKKTLLKGLETCMAKYAVAALTDSSGQPIYDTITSSDQIEHEYRQTVLPPKKFFFPPREQLLEYTKGENGRIANVKPTIEAKPLVLFGVRPCDLNGIKILTEAFSEKYGDPHFIEKRDKAIVIGMECTHVCDEHAFCYKVRGNEARGGYDLLLIDRGDYYLIQVGTDKGGSFLSEYVATSSGNSKEVEAFYQEKKASFLKAGGPFRRLEELPDICEKNPNHQVWKDEGARCFSCGACVMVCPTCYCFDVVDEFDLNLKAGKRLRCWDGCMLHHFADVAGGSNFRGQKEDRLRHRMNRKFNWLMRKHGQSVCVGCGRCPKACLVDINPRTIAEALLGEGTPGQSVKGGNA